MSQRPVPETPQSRARHLKDLGNDLFRARDFPGALDHYSRAILLDPSQPAFYSNRAACHIELRDYRAADRDTRNALTRAPVGDRAARARILCKRARAQVRAGDVLGAKGSLELARRESPGCEEIAAVVKEVAGVEMRRRRDREEAGDDDDMPDLQPVGSSDSEDSLDMPDLGAASDSDDAGATAREKTNDTPNPSTATNPSTHSPRTSDPHHSDPVVARERTPTPSTAAARNPPQPSPPAHDSGDDDLPAIESEGDEPGATPDDHNVLAAHFSNIPEAPDNAWDRAVAVALFGKDFLKLPRALDFTRFFGSHRAAARATSSAARRRQGRGHACLPSCIPCWAKAMWNARFAGPAAADGDWKKVNEGPVGPAAIHAVLVIMRLQGHAVWMDPRSVSRGSDAQLKFAEVVEKQSLGAVKSVLRHTEAAGKLAALRKNLLCKTPDAYGIAKPATGEFASGGAAAEDVGQIYRLWMARESVLVAEERAAGKYLWQTLLATATCCAQGTGYANIIAPQFEDFYNHRIRYLARVRYQRRAYLQKKCDVLMQGDRGGRKAERAFLYVDEALQRDATSPNLLHSRAMCHLLQGHWKLALSDTDKAERNQKHEPGWNPIVLAVTRAGCHHARATNYGEAENWKAANHAFTEAIEQYDKAVRQTPTLPGVGDFVNDGLRERKREAEEALALTFEKLRELELGNPSRPRETTPKRADLPKVETNATTSGAVDEDPGSDYEETSFCVVDTCKSRDIDKTKGWAEVVCTEGCVSTCHKQCLRTLRRLDKKGCPRPDCSGRVFERQDVFMDLSNAAEKRRNRVLPPQVQVQNPKTLEISRDDERRTTADAAHKESKEAGRPRVESIKDHGVGSIAGTADNPSGSHSSKPVHSSQESVAGAPKRNTASLKGKGVSVQLHDKAFAPKFKAPQSSTSSTANAAGPSSQPSNYPNDFGVSEEELISVVDFALVGPSSTTRTARTSKLREEIRASTRNSMCLETIEARYGSLEQFCRAKSQAFLVDDSVSGGDEDPIITCLRDVGLSSTARWNDVVRSAQWTDGAAPTPAKSRQARRSGRKEKRATTYTTHMEDFPDPVVASAYSAYPELRAEMEAQARSARLEKNRQQKQPGGPTPQMVQSYASAATRNPSNATPGLGSPSDRAPPRALLPDSVPVPLTSSSEPTLGSNEASSSSACGVSTKPLTPRELLAQLELQVHGVMPVPWNRETEEECILCQQERAEIRNLPCGEITYCRHCAQEVCLHAAKKGKKKLLCPLYDRSEITGMEYYPAGQLRQAEFLE